MNFTKAFFLFLSSITISKSTLAQLQLEKDLAGHFTFQAEGRNLIDNSVMKNSGVSFLEDSLGNAANFDGKSFLTGGDDFNISANQPVSIAFLLNISDLSVTSPTEGIIGKINSTNGWSVIRTSEQPKRLTFKLKNRENQEIRIESPDVLSPNIWKHILFTYDGSGKAEGFKLYVNGSIKNLTIKSDNLQHGSVTENEDNFLIGSLSQTGGFFTGKLDEVRFYKRELSETQVYFFHFRDYHTNGLSSYYQFKNLGNDESGNDHTLKSFNTTECAGVRGDGLEFDGKTSFLTEKHLYNFSKSDPFTISFWAKPSMTVNSSPQVFLSRMKSDFSRGWAILRKTNHPDALSVILRNSNNSNELRVSTGKIFTENSWKHIIVRHDGTGKISGINIFVNGNLVPLSVESNNLTEEILSDAAFTIGAADNSTGFYKGQIDEVKIFKDALCYETLSGLSEGHWTVSDPLAELTSDNYNFHIYQNPVNHQITIETSGLPEKAEIFLFDPAGKRIFTGTTHGKSSNFSIKDLKGGSYHYQIIKMGEIKKEGTIDFN